MIGENNHHSSIPLASVKFLSMRSLMAVIQPTFVDKFAVACTKWEERRILKSLKY